MSWALRMSKQLGVGDMVGEWSPGGWRGREVGGGVGRCPTELPSLSSAVLFIWRVLSSRVGGSNKREWEH